jgi:hypothetical protein
MPAFAGMMGRDGLGAYALADMDSALATASSMVPTM